MKQDAIILAGGRARRLQGADKGALILGGTSLLDRAVLAVAPARTVVVGPRQPPTARPVLWTREDPPFGGPAAAVAAGLEKLCESGAPAQHVVLLAVDVAVARDAVDALQGAVGAEAPADDGWVAKDPDGHRQPLLGIYRSDALRGACARLTTTRGGLDGASMRDLLAPLRLRDVLLEAALTADIDTPIQFAAAAAAPERGPDDRPS
ncbi:MULTISPECIES: NTP transferase domain-containing protein [unclassified Curtobacterium]|uniref:molybdenum cofactor guanylyltransferase n=1 Tax=unclassified Curtobacterium TaxID=257496 RepID=UPI0015E891D0|nr:MULTISPECIES: NTP transferase domain-containing protein [unclassified Curtobacterium]WIE79228.1 NTP transferase domain-containing protein [Curtobacterium sp. MCSS17_016]